MLIQPLIVPILLCTVALFFASFLSWMILPFHRKDWVKLQDDERVLQSLRDVGVKPGSYMLPGCEKRADMQSEAHMARVKQGPVCVLTVFTDINMGRNLGLTVVYFFVVSACLAYLAMLGLKPGDDFLSVFRFVSTAGLMTFLSAIVQHSIWFRNRIVGHVAESILYAAIVGAIFAAMWPAA